ncbi:ComF family protein [Pseudomonas shahriarae]|uniref:ComF family protein n=1 Tax=Pseudomonas shahriarae TaxID=2745512 RepID=UPI001644F135|nr:ComF family protein [Pseudomonas shahriarae]QXH90724.1 ComF family protein [Pseudomonas shahriarae]
MKVNVKEIGGNWAKGFALDKHVLRSEFLGYNSSGYPEFNNTRSEAGEALFQLKYRDDQDQAQILAAQIVESIYPLLDTVGFIVPMPASKDRAWQPVTQIALEVGKLTALPVFQKILTKKPTGQSLKDLGSRDERVKALEGKIQLGDEISGNGKWNVLLVDDRYDTGASVEAACAVLKTYSKVNNIYVATVTW